MLRNLDIGLLRTLIHVADCGSMTAAASRLHMTQGAVSQQIKRLEETLDSAILERGRRGVRLTGDGERLLAKARQLVALNDDMVASMPAPSMTGQVRLGVPHDLIATHLPVLLQAFARQHPRIEIALVAGSSLELRQAYDTGKVDLALIEEAAGAMSGECLSLEQPVWVGAADGAAWTRRPLPVCMVSDTCVLRQPAHAALAGAGIAWRRGADYASMEATVATVQADLAVSAWLASTVPAHLQILGETSGLPPLPGFAITLHAPRHGASQVGLAMAHCIRAHYADRLAV